MAERKPFLLRIDREVLEAVQRWADDDLRSLNGQIEFMLRRALKEAGRERTGEEAIEETASRLECQDSSYSSSFGGTSRVEGRSASR